MIRRDHQSSLRYFLLATGLVLLDQITKVAVKGGSMFGFSWEGMRLGESINVMGETLRWTFVENPGMAWGIQFGDGKIILTIVTIVITALLGWYLHRIREQHWSAKLAIALILAGAFGNLIDRALYGVFYGESPLFYGKVVDFIQVDIPDVDVFGSYYTHFPVFNIADSCVSVGVVLLFFVSNKLQKARPEPPEVGSPEQAKVDTHGSESELSRQD